jgi:two-component system, OmpR family, alkaline phosphatase synthesis response regulator PhoP
MMAETNSGLPSQLRILIVDDDADAVFLLEHQLRRHGHTTVAAHSATEARQCLLANDLDVILSDIHLPDQSGLDLLRWVRARAEPCQIIIFTGHPSVESAIEALRLGSIDYLTKPVTEAALTAALRRLQKIRRPPRETAPLPATSELRPPANQRQYRLGPVVLDLDRFVVSVNGGAIETTPTELEILHYLFRHANRVVTPQELVKSLRGEQVEAHQAPEIIRPHVSNLRRKLLAAAAEADVVQTVRGVGYMLRTL